MFETVLAFPGSYGVGMSSLGFHRVYKQLAEWPDTICERAFVPESDELAWRRRTGRPFTTLESGRSLRSCDLLAFSLSYEPDYITVLEMISQSGIAPLASERRDNWPILMAGGLCVTANPIPMAPFFDVMVIGESEPTLGPVLDTIKSMGSQGAGKKRILSQLAGLPGIYVPPVHGTRAPRASIMRQWAGVESIGAHSVIESEKGVFSDTILMEVSRGCPFNCRFCMPGYVYLPYRECRTEDVEIILRGLPEGSRIAFVACSPDSHPAFGDILRMARDLGHEVSIGSQRADQPSQLGEADLSGTTLTIAPETGSDSLRRVIGKSIRNDAILRTISEADGKVSRIRLYFIIGFPFETAEDRADIPALVAQMREITGIPITASINPFVPKPWTAFQWSPMARVDDLRRWREELGRALRAVPGVEPRFLGAREAHIQALLARGDHRTADALLARLAGDGWPQAFSKAGIDMDWVFSPVKPGTGFEWDFINMGFGYTRLAREYSLAASANQSRQRVPERLSEAAQAGGSGATCC